VRTQLLVHAHLFRQEANHLPGALVAFSLRHGAVHIDFSERDIDGLLEQVQAARKQPSAAFPDPAGCRFCRRRLRCEPHWEVEAAWEDPDYVEGVISRTERSSTGFMAIRVDTVQGQQWITGVASSMGGGPKPGDTVRFTEVVGQDELLAKEWRATRSTRAVTVSRRRCHGVTASLRRLDSVDRAKWTNVLVIRNSSDAVVYNVRARAVMNGIDEVEFSAKVRPPWESSFEWIHPRKRPNQIRA